MNIEKIEKITSLVESGSLDEDTATTMIKDYLFESTTDNSKPSIVTLEDALNYIDTLIEEKKKCKDKGKDDDEKCPECGKKKCVCDDKEDKEDEDDEDEEDEEELKESVNLRIQSVLNAYDAGIITEEEKNSLMPYLDLSNYN